MHKHTARQRKHLGLVLHSPKGCREDQAVIVTLEFGAVVVSLGVMVFLAESLVCY